MCILTKLPVTVRIYAMVVTWVFICISHAFTSVAEYYFAGVGKDEAVFADGKVVTFGQIIGVVLARDQPLAQRAVKAVKVTYQDLPSVITIEV